MWVCPIGAAAVVWMTSVPSQSVFAIDPGSRKLGWAVVRASGGRTERLDSGVVRLPERLPVTERLGLLHTELVALFARHPTRHLAIEAAFVRDNPQTALVLGMARGVPIALAAASGWTISEYPPALVKRTLVGSGRADKYQMQRMIQLVLGLPDLPQEDEADALAVALTCLRAPGVELQATRKALAGNSAQGAAADGPSAAVSPAKAAWLGALAAAGSTKR